jgi:hypothetical protein
MKWTAIEGIEASYEAADKFHKAMQELFGNLNGGSDGDVFGGTLHFIYLPQELNEAQPALVEDLKMFADALKDEELVDRLAEEARAEYRRQLSNKISTATRELQYEVMAPLYEAAGIKPKWTDIHYEHRDFFRGHHGAKTLIRKQIKSGVTVSKIVRQMGRGRPPKWTRSKLDQMIRSKFASYLKKHYRKPTISAMAKELDIPDVTLKKLMQRYGIKYSYYKKTVDYIAQRKSET